MKKKNNDKRVQARPGQWRAKKALGQNFLKSIPALNKIISVGEIKIEDTILEIGPGKGALTSKLLGYAGKVIAIEKDRELVEFLREKFEKEIKEKKLILLEEDILDFDLSQIPARYKLIANIPYNITGAILKKFLAGGRQPEKMVLMVQYEVAKRIVSNEGKENLLSISVKAYGEPKMVMKVPRRYFSPAPNVDSAIIEIKNISKSIFEKNKTDEEKFWNIVHAGFAHKRKILISNLKRVDNKMNWAEIFEQLNLKDKARAEDLSVMDWINLVKHTK